MTLRSLLVAALFVPLTAVAQTPAAKAITAVLDQQAADWNRGDLAAFERGYKNSPDILFIGRSVRRGYAQMQASYAKGYPTAEARGTLSFTGLEVHPLDAHFATVLGHYHLERVAAGGGNADGVFSLVFEKTATGWKIILDHTTDIPAPTHP